MPDNEEVPKFCRRFRLGGCINKIRNRGDYVRDSTERFEILEGYESIFFFFRRLCLYCNATRRQSSF